MFMFYVFVVVVVVVLRVIYEAVFCYLSVHIV